MSRAYKCDCCGKLFESYLEGENIKQVTVSETTNRLKGSEKVTFDVCKECFKKIEKILNQNAKIKEKAQSENKPDCFGNYDEKHPCKNSGCKLKRKCIEESLKDKDEDYWDDELLED